jgi:Arc/MetJ-type ribon-helix-helix transcriptional regulator
MPLIQISLPDDLKEFVDSEAVAGGYAGAGQYVQELLRIVWKQKSKADLEGKLIDAMESEPAIEATPEFWKKLRTRVHERART